ncbi:hypothetical protein EDC19_2132 [Natranaerovirga hydrolytica]|uniref:FMN-binding protein n=1 Tax=Natranaerovirga hydrolytica TaxID=680378 RepID=A0A4R1MJ00_9FIRM|nr:hypothetical protein [Natranaerovirga hydrolytica]TCK92397.1 hypothetical protein EDC19_2132 [Natranaerovirga hydrolytica]
MSTKIIVVQLKEIIYTAIFIGLGIFLILLLIFMFTPNDTADVEPSNNYIPGVYTSSLIMDNQAVNVEVRVDEQDIRSIQIVDLDPAVETLYPLLRPSLENISDQLVANTEIDDIHYDLENQHISSVLVDVVKNALNKADPELHN